LEAWEEKKGEVNFKKKVAKGGASFKTKRGVRKRGGPLCKHKLNFQKLEKKTKGGFFGNSGEKKKKGLWGQSNMGPKRFLRGDSGVVFAWKGEKLVCGRQAHKGVKKARPQDLRMGALVFEGGKQPLRKDQQKPGSIEKGPDCKKRGGAF